MLAELDLVLSALPAAAAVVGDAPAPALILFNPYTLPAKPGEAPALVSCPCFPSLHDLELTSAHLHVARLRCPRASPVDRRKRMLLAGASTAVYHTPCGHGRAPCTPAAI